MRQARWTATGVKCPKCANITEMLVVVDPERYEHNNEVLEAEQCPACGWHVSYQDK